MIAECTDPIIDIHARLDALERTRSAQSLEPANGVMKCDIAAAASLGFELSTGGDIKYSDGYTAVSLSCGLLAVPHGKTLSNQRHLFQDHSDSQLSQLLPEGIQMARRGAAAFVQEYDEQLRLNSWRIFRSPLNRTAATAEQYVLALREVGVEVQVDVDPNLIEINHGSWAGLTVSELADAGRTRDAELGQQYRDGSFVARATDGSGESKLNVLCRAAEWLKALESELGGKSTNVLVFGHGTFQNCLELLLRCYPQKSADEIFSRDPTGGSHLRRGETHLLAELR